MIGYSRQQKCLATVAICAAGYGAYSDSVVYPIASTIAADFPGITSGAINLFLTGASAIAAVIAAVLAGFLVKWIHKRTLIVLGTIFFLVGGVASFWAEDFSFLIAMRALDGFSDGLIATTVAAMITQVFPDEAERARVFSLHIVAALVFSIITGSLSGVLCRYGWRYSFLANSASVVSVLLAVLFLPDTPLEPKHPPQGQKQPWNPGIPLGAIVMYMLLSALAFVCSICSSFYVTENNLGGSALVGFSQSAGKIICLVITLSFSWIYARFKTYIPVVSCLSFSLIYFLLYRLGSPMTLFLAMGILNIGMSLIPTYFELKVSEHTPEYRMGLMMGLYSVSVYGGNLLCPYVPTTLQKVLGLSNYTQTYLPIALILSGITLFYLAQLLLFRKKS